MDLSGKTIEVCQLSHAIAHLMREVLAEQGALSEPESGALADLLLIDLEALAEERFSQRLRRYQEQGRPVIWTGLRPLRELLPDPQAPWLERPFSPAALLTLCAQRLGVRVALTRSPSSGDGSGGDARAYEHIPDLELIQAPTTRELELDEAALLEEEFGLEPGVLGGKAEILVDLTAALDLRQIKGAHDLAVNVSALLDDDLLHGGRVFSEVESRLLTPQELELPPPRLVADERMGASYHTTPDLPASRNVPRDVFDEHDPPTLDVMMRAGGAMQEDDAAFDEAFDEVAALVAEASSEGVARSEAGEVMFAAMALDEETSLELRGFARRLAESFGQIGLSARVEDRFEHINRALRALFERGLDGVNAELARIPNARGFSGSLDVLGLKGLFDTLRDRGLRGRLELATVEQTYVLYLDGSHLCEIDALAEDAELLLLEVLRERSVLDERACARLRADHADPEGLHAPVELRLRSEGIVSEGAIREARRVCAQQLFSRVYRAQGMTFAFIELRRDAGHAWPVHDLGLDVEALWREASSEASRAVSELLEEETCDLGALVTRQASGAVTHSSPPAMPPSPPAMPPLWRAARHSEPQQQLTRVLELDARALDARSTQEEAAAQRDAVSGTFPLIGSESDTEAPTRNVKPHHAPLPPERPGEE